VRDMQEPRARGDGMSGLLACGTDDSPDYVANPLSEWGTLSRAARDAAYNNTAAVPDVAAIHAARTVASDMARAAASAALNLAYGPDERHRIDVFPAADARAPCFVFIHGGYWQMNSKESFACLGDGVRVHGWSAAFVGYSLAPQATLTQIVGEISRALDWLSEHGANYGAAGPLVVAGWSAGGHLAALALDHPAVVAGLGISGIYELGPLRDTYLNEKLALSDEQVVTLSPLRRPVVPKPMAITYGTCELPALIANSRRLHAYRAAANAPGALLPAPGRNHFTILEELRLPQGFLTRQVLMLPA
jgi:arylformamidase